MINIRKSLHEQFYAILVLLIVLFVFNNVAVKLSLYWTYRWLDIPMHFIGGALVTWFSFVCFAFWRKDLYIPWIYTLVFAFGIGFAWEIIEFYAKVSQMVPEYGLDTTKDLFMDMIGGLVVYMIWDSVRVNTSKNPK